jgi:hypothetical protein
LVATLLIATVIAALLGEALLLEFGVVSVASHFVLELFEVRRIRSYVKSWGPATIYA